MMNQFSRPPARIAAQNMHIDPDSSAAHVKPQESHDVSVNMEIMQNSSIVIPTQTTTNVMSITSEDLRKGFIRKVLFILMAQLGLTTLLVTATLIESTGLATFMKKNPAPTYVAVAAAFIALCALGCWRNIFRKVPQNYVLLFIFTIGCAYFFAGITALTGSKVVLYTTACVVGTTVGISIYTLATKREFIKQWYFISGAAPIFFLLLVFAVVFKGNGLDYIFSGLFALIYLAFFTFDITRLAGRYESKFTLDEYIVAALDLYIDVVMMFFYVLDILICNGTYSA